MKTSTFLLQIFFIIFFWVISSCSSGSDAEKDNSSNIEEPPSDIVLQSTREVFKTLPTPSETAELIFMAEIKFDSKILNPVQNVSYYETSQSMALNLGIYSADLSFSCLFNQNQVTLDYLNAVKTLSDALGLIHILKQEDIIRLEDNLYNKDSIKLMVENLFFNSNEFLNDNNRPEIALLVEVGGWVEGLYIAMQMAKQSGSINKELVDRVVEQYESLLLVIKSLENFSKLPALFEVLNDMYRLKDIYDKMVIPNKETTQKDKKANLSKNAGAVVTPDLFLQLYHEIINIRNGYTQ
jgi:hypothetical protein